ncbi:hypothetical protein MERGE_001263 [Pneumocystis wakefieldiae]|uniref:poly(A)-specific ribonuclease n=1 Tax=Pneumocystis wakefieldiae TaxID=38082 RepID=A0A899G1U9_9ASCO|nr:hypothetical protein MERGE_001263 [Pneumocystis wakefieldiae]
MGPRVASQHLISPSVLPVREVWAVNLDSEMAYLRELVECYNFLAMNIEFPGVIARPIGSFLSGSDYYYQMLRCNVDLLKIIQLGITFSDSSGNFPPDACTWQFNFKFSLNDDMYSQDSIELLQKNGIDFKRHEEYGIDVNYFGELLISSGFVLLDCVKWTSFHSSYDFGYLLKIMICNCLPVEENEFYELLHIFFPKLYDIKYIIKFTNSLEGGLQDIADDLRISRTGLGHQAGSGSFLIARVFFELKMNFLKDILDDAKYTGYLYGLENPGQEKGLDAIPAASSSVANNLASNSHISNKEVF